MANFGVFVGFLSLNEGVGATDRTECDVSKKNTIEHAICNMFPPAVGQDKELPAPKVLLLS